MNEKGMSSLSDQLAVLLNLDPGTARRDLADYVSALKSGLETGNPVRLDGVGVFTSKDGTIEFEADESLQGIVNHRYRDLPTLSVDESSKAGGGITSQGAAPASTEEEPIPWPLGINSASTPAAHPDKLDEPVSSGQPSDTLQNGQPYQDAEFSVLGQEMEVTEIKGTPAVSSSIEAETAVWEDSDIPESEATFKPEPQGPAFEESGGSGLGVKVLGAALLALLAYSIFAIWNRSSSEPEPSQQTEASDNRSASDASRGASQVQTDQDGSSVMPVDGDLFTIVYATFRTERPCHPGDG